MVRKAFEHLTGKKTRLIVFSDDMDALRKVPNNVPNKEMLEKHIGKSLCKIPNPFDTEHKSFSEHNNAMLKTFLDKYGFEYEFMSAYALYNNSNLTVDVSMNKENATYRIMSNLDEIANVVTHDYGEERKKTYCPVIPIDPRTHQHIFDIENYLFNSSSDYNTMTFKTQNGETDQINTANPYGGNSFKFQWKVDWPFRWAALQVDYEMHGKDLLGSVAVARRIMPYLKQQTPLTYMYELFTDQEGKKISKSVGNGLDFTDWINYAPADSLRWFLFQNPRKSRKLYMEMVPDVVDRFIKELSTDYNEDSGAWALYGNDKVVAPEISYQMLLNLVNITDTQNPTVLWTYIQNYAPTARPGKNALLDEMVEGAIRFYTDFIKDTKVYRIPGPRGSGSLRALALQLRHCADDNKALQGNDLATVLMTDVIYEIGKQIYGKENLHEYFQMLYQVLMGQDSGPRFGQFVVAYGVDNTIEMLEQKSLQFENL